VPALRTLAMLGAAALALASCISRHNRTGLAQLYLQLTAAQLCLRAAPKVRY